MWPYKRRCYVMTKEKEPLSEADYERVLSSAHNIGGDCLNTILFLRWTGAHISVLSQPAKHNLRIENHPDGLYIMWERPKKKGRQAHVDIKAHKNLIGVYDVGAWIETLKRREQSKNPRKISRQYFYQLVKQAGVSAGKPNLSPMTFRHTFGVWLLNQGAPQEFVRQKLNVSPRVLQTYLKYTRETDIPMYKRLGF